MKQRGMRELDHPPSPDTQPRWDIPEVVVVGAAVSGRIANEAGTTRNFALDFESFQRETIAAVSVGASFVHIDTGGIASIEQSGHSVPQMYDKIFNDIRAEIRRDWVPDANILRGKNFAENVYPITAGLIETTVMAPNFPVDWMEAVAKVTTDRGCRLFFVAHSTAEVDLANRLIISKGLVNPPLCWDVLIGYPYDDATDRLCTYLAHPRAMMQELMLIVDRIREIDPTSFIMVNASGRAGHYLATQAMLMGLHVRTGTEDMAFRFPHKNEMLENNRETVERTRQTAEVLGRRLATPNEYRRLIGLPEKKVDPL